MTEQSTHERTDARETWLARALRQLGNDYWIRARSSGCAVATWLYAADGDEIVALRPAIGVKRSGRRAAEQLHRAVAKPRWNIELVEKSELQDLNNSGSENDCCVSEGKT
jgi:hypothetical protein